MGKVIYQRRGSISHIIMNSTEKRNAVDEEFIHDMRNCFMKFNNDPKALVAIISSAGHHFSVGADLSLGIPSVEFAQHSLEMLPSIIGVMKPTIAVIEGYCLGGGWMIAQECDIRVATYDCKFGIPEVKWNFVPPFCAGFIHQHLPPTICLESMLTGNVISGIKAYQIGFINRVVDKESIMKKAMEIAEKMCGMRYVELIERKKYFTDFLRNQKHGEH